MTTSCCGVPVTEHVEEGRCVDCDRRLCSVCAAKFDERYVALCHDCHDSREYKRQFRDWLNDMGV